MAHGAPYIDLLAGPGTRDGAENAQARTRRDQQSLTAPPASRSIWLTNLHLRDLRLSCLRKRSSLV